MTSSDDVAGHGVERPSLLVAALMAICTVAAIVSSVGAPLVPTVASAYDVSFASAQWTLTVTMLVGAVTVPVLGRLGDGPRRRAVIIGALSVVLIGCVMASVPGNFALLIGGRALQGIGFGLAPLAMAVARDHLPPARARSCVAALAVTAVAGIGLGYPLTGAIAHTWGYHACFVVAGVAAAVVLLAAILAVPPSGHIVRTPLDVLGALLLGAGSTLLLVAISMAPQWGFITVPTIGCAVVGSLVLALWSRHELRIPHPLIQIRLLANRSVLTADVTGLLAGVGMFVLSSAVIRFVQTPPDTGYGLGESATMAGLILVPFSIASVFSHRLLSILGRRMKKSLVMPLGASAFVVSLILFLTARGELWVLFALMGVAGLGLGLTFAAMPGLIVSAVPPHETGSALGLNQVARTVGGAVGSAVSATVLAVYTDPAERFPSDTGYAAIAWVGIGLWTVTAVTAFAISSSGERRATDRGIDPITLDRTTGALP